MWERKAIKQRARAGVKRNYSAIVAVCFLVAVITGGYASATAAARQYNDDASLDGSASADAPYANTTANLWSLVETLSQESISHANGGDIGVINGAISAVSSSRGPVARVSGIVYGFLSGDTALSQVLRVLAVLAALFYHFAVANVVEVGEKRYLLEARRYTDTRVRRVLSMYRDRGVWHVVWVMIQRDVKLVLWWLTIVGGIIKSYEYRMVPYVLAQHTEMSAKEVFAESRRMMDHNKWKTFVLDVTFWPWQILSSITLGLVGIFWVNPYRATTQTELFAALAPLPEVDAPTPNPWQQTDRVHHHPIEVDYDRSYTLVSLVLLFFTFSIFGWVWEVALQFVTNGILVNRGVLTGPWLPIYGSGGVLVLVLLKKVRDKPILTFLLTMVVSGIVEYGTSWYLEATKGVRWWDYSGFFLNLNGRICLEGLVLFGLGGCAFVYFLAPLFDDLYKKVPRTARLGACGVLLVLFCADLIYSNAHPNVGKGVTDYGAAAQSEAEDSAVQSEATSSVTSNVT